ncbi:uncharacterized protein BJX67DRAFT_380724 [Aspergillus lucknowensis]|uniref:Uncharacterized protein n=1 Tax=Aspergillus lucknowensis TaxID=176173 RepID=A0ABR4LTB6_9EURO
MSSFTPTMYTNSVYDVFLGYEEYPTPEVNTKWIVIVHSRTGKSCQWYTTAQLPLLTGYYMHEKFSISIPTDSHVRCEYNVNKAPIGALDETELGLMDALFEVTEPEKSRKEVHCYVAVEVC